jgi:hypothetical protein
MPSKMKTCEDYRTALSDAAAAAVEPSRELRSHLDACASCRAAFAEETQLFAAIDTGLRATANSEVPASLFPRVRAQLNERPVARRSWVPAVAAVAAVAALIVAIVFVRGLGRGATATNPQTIVAVHNDLPASTQTSAQTVVPIEATSPFAKIKPIRPVETVSGAKIEQVAVLIPDGQKQAIDLLLASVRSGKVGGEVLLVEKPEKTLEELQVSPLDIPLIEIKPLEDVSADSPSQDKKTGR